MNPEFTREGVTIRTYSEIFEDLADQMRGVYGNSITVDQDSPDGQFLGIIAKEILDLETYAWSLYAQFDPDFAEGEMLNKIIKICGISRTPSTQSTCEVTITTTTDLTLDAGYEVADDNEQSWITKEDQDLTTGENTVTLYAEEYGKVEAQAGEINSPVTIVIGVSSVTNPADATAGTDEETDEELRIRRQKSLENASYSTVSGLLAKIEDIEEVSDAVIHENTDDDEDDNGIPGHSIWLIVDGGDVEDIAEIMAKNKTAGTGMKGDTSGIYTETVTKTDGTTFEINHEMKFDRPTDIELYISLTVTRTDTDSPADTDLMKEYLVALEYSIGDSVQANSLYSTVYNAGTNFVATDLKISDDGTTYTTGRLTPAVDERYTISTDNTTITEVV
jgi:uncharacterized phage protein gp47/JayE